MEKYDYIVKSSEIRKLLEKRMYQKALQIMNTMDMNKIKDMADLSLFAEVYMQTEHYNDAEKILLRLRDRSSSRRIIYQLIKLAIKRKNIEDAEYYYNEFLEAAPRDADKFILRYRIDKMEGKDFPVLIESLKELKQYDYTEKWAYELAKLYHRAGMVDRCINECSDIILWFGEGVVVEKAKMLREHYLGSESNIPEGAPLMNTRQEEDYLEQEELELQEEEKDYHKALYSAVDKTKENSAEESVEEENSQDSQFATKDLTNISKMLENYFEEEKQVMELQAAEKEVEETAEENVEETTEENVEETTEETTEETEESTPEEPEQVPQQEIPVAIPEVETFRLEPYKELFGRFYTIASIRSQVVTLVNDMLKEVRPYSFAITGCPKSGKTALGKSIIKLLYELNIFPYKKVAKISSERLNELSLEDNYERLQDGYLIVEGAGALKPENQLQLIKMLRDLKDHMLVILEDSQENLQALFHTYPMLTNYIKETVKVEDYGKEELYDYAVDFFTEKKFVLEEDAEIMLGVVCEEVVEREEADQRPEKLLEELGFVLAHLEQRGLQEVTNGKDMDDSDINTIIASDFGNE